ncbi:unnamed protein product [Rotaria magnacalcarata]|uniref:Cyclic nucleotide-binding domain-containing protein n=1 Tax=Rotaria magnacalcarata TaxID=392030 RepID=A0A820S5X4_9BILA|nr:unnamed protein product [Rotaria magnacalcarata]CAF4450613.1 unnamed protein product [Rotaria magnacalcarata]
MVTDNFLSTLNRISDLKVLLSSIQIFKHLDNHELFHIAGNSEDIEFNDKTNIIVQGEKSQNFLSTQRTVQISKKSEPNQSPIKSSSFGTIH